jgi:hypothetical protein
VQDTAAKLATEYKAEEIAFFKALASRILPLATVSQRDMKLISLLKQVAKIMLAREMSYCVSQTEAVKLAKPPVTRMLAIQLIKSFLAKGSFPCILSSLCSHADSSLSHILQVG